MPGPVWPPGSVLPGLGPVTPRRLPGSGPAPEPAAATPFARLPRTLDWAWWRPLIALVIGGVLALGASMVVFVAGVTIAVLVGDADSSLIGLERYINSLLVLDASDPLALGISLASIAVWIPAVYLALLCAGMRPLGHVTSVAYRMRWGWLGACFGPAGIAMGASVLVTFGLFPFLPGGAYEPDWTPLGELAAALLVVLLLVPFQAAAEEYVFRGMLPQALASWLPWRTKAWRWVPFLVPTAAFTFSHGYGLWGLLDVTVFALAAMWLTWRTGGIEAAIALHVLNNVVAFGVLGSGVLGSTENAAEGGSPIALALTAATSLLYVWLVERIRRRRGLAVTSPWPEVVTR
ncbi:Abortive infection protein [Beutenbergia cavernae DSM 12333]|uniref:Abortive infection protein n=2 Tax=Beutenbergia TaxID=84756 RepID=C5C4U1_BEUC1|nr:Abortive infection protein [Beutenbergia cavernae DSM 12333]